MQSVFVSLGGSQAGGQTAWSRWLRGTGAPPASRGVCGTGGCRWGRWQQGARGCGGVCARGAYSRCPVRQGVSPAGRWQGLVEASGVDASMAAWRQNSLGVQNWGRRSGGAHGWQPPPHRARRRPLTRPPTQLVAAPRSQSSCQAAYAAACTTAATAGASAGGAPRPRSSSSCLPARAAHAAAPTATTAGGATAAAAAAAKTAPRPRSSSSCATSESDIAGHDDTRSAERLQRPRRLWSPACVSE